MKIFLPIILKGIMALMFVVFGANKLFKFMPDPDMDASNLGAMAFFGAMMGSYLGKLVAITEVAGGILLFVKEKLAALILLPVTINIMVFHLSHDIATIPGGIIVFGINVYLIIKNKEAYQAILD